MNQQGNYPFSVPENGLEDAKKMYNKHSGWLKFALLLAVAGLLGGSSFYQVEPDELAVVTRLGKFTETTESGLRFKIPLIDQVQKVLAKRQLKQEFGFRTMSAGVKSEFRRDLTTLRESMMLTGDLNVAVVEWIVHYKISDPYQYLFKVRNVEETLRGLTEATMRAVVGDHSVTEVLTKGREQILEQARIQLAELCKRYETGIAIQRIELKDSAPPDMVKPSFNEVNQAEQVRDRLQNEAWAQYNKEIPKARGEAKQLIQEAEGYAVERVNRSKGDAERFLSIQREYSRAPSVTRTRIYLETMTEVLPKAGRKVLMDKEAKNVVPLLFPEGSSATAGGAR
jgi:modulator of FtsH protease HflK